jgi:hypothetical protein
LLGDVTSSAVQLPLKSVSQVRTMVSEQPLDVAVEQTEEMEDVLLEVRAFRRGETQDWMPEAPLRALRKVEQPVEMEEGISVD